MRKIGIVLSIAGILLFGVISQGFSEDGLENLNLVNFIFGDQENSFDSFNEGVLLAAVTCSSYTTTCTTDHSDCCKLSGSSCVNKECSELTSNNDCSSCRTGCTWVTGNTTHRCKVTGSAQYWEKETHFGLNTVNQFRE